MPQDLRRVSRIAAHLSAAPAAASFAAPPMLIGGELCAHLSAAPAAASFAAPPMLIGGELCQAEGGKVADVLNPATGQPFACVPDASEADLDRAVAAAKTAFGSWKKTSFAERARCLTAFADALEAKKTDFAKALTMEQGKPLMFAMGEVMTVIKDARQFAATGELKPVVTADTKKARHELHFLPRGVVGAITPWNFPLMMAANKILPAVTTGNTVVLKPSPYTPLATVMLSALAAEAFPAGVMNILTGGNSLGQRIVEHPDIAHISFTGSAATGKRIMATGASKLKKLTLELGGNDAALVLPDASVAKIAPAIFQKSMFNTGQVCIAIKRLFVHESQYDEMCAALAKEAAAAKVGDGMAKGTAYGPINNKMQLERVEGLVADARARGANVIAGGQRVATETGGYFYAPTIVRDVTEGMRIVDEEQFGPVLPVIKYSSVEDAVRRANDSDFGLGASVWTADPTGRGVDVARELEAGMTWINDHLAQPDTLPFGGIKTSGIGREGGGEIGLKEFCDMRTLTIPYPKK